MSSSSSAADWQEILRPLDGRRFASWEEAEREFERLYDRLQPAELAGLPPFVAYDLVRIADQARWLVADGDALILRLPRPYQEVHFSPGPRTRRSPLAAVDGEAPGTRDEGQAKGPDKGPDEAPDEAHERPVDG